MANTYITIDDLKLTLDITGTKQDADLQRAVDASSRAIEKACSRRGLRRFWQDTEDVQRIYTAGDPYLLEIHDAYEVSLVESDEDGDGVYETTWDESDWILTPLNAQLDDEPWTALVARASQVGSTERRRFPNVFGGVRVTAKYGWPAVPPFVPQAVTLVASRLAMRSRKAPFAVIGFGTDQVALHIARTDPDVAGLIHDYIRDASSRSVRLG